jgi:starch phosphorylase
VPLDEVPIGHVTNGVHFRSWISYEMKQLYDRYLGPDWSDQPGDAAWWKRADSIPAEELWRTHERRRERLVGFARNRLRSQLERRGAPPSEIQAAEEVLDAEALTIGFARRFATYKRATLLLRDPERLARILNDAQRPVQFIYAGKAHPKDEGGKRLISDIIALARRPEFRRHIVFLEDYDMAMARSLVQGCDVWLNTPLRPLEASGTSGMKACANGALNLSTLDGWWDEAWRESDTALIGWAIGNGETYADQNYQDQVEAEALYNLLERDVVPAFYERGRDRVPKQWIARMRASLSRLCWKYNTHRMVEQYTGEFYTMAHVRFAELDAGGAVRARGLAAWKQRVRAAWPQVRIDQVEDAQALTLKVGDKLHVKAHVQLGPLDPDDVQVELYVGLVDAHGDLVSPVPYQIQAAGKDGNGAAIFEGTAATCEASGEWGFTVRVLPYHSDLLQPYPPGLIVWA